MDTVNQTIPLELPERSILAVRDILDSHIRCELHFAHRLDAQRLHESFEHLAARYPFLAMGVNMEGERPVFSPLKAGGRVEWIETVDASGFEAYLAGSHDCFDRAQLRMALQSLEDGGTRVAFIASHMAVDSAGMRQCLRELGAIYTALGGGEEPSRDPRPTRRDPALIVKPRQARGFAALWTSVRLFARLMKTPRTLSPQFPAGDGPAIYWHRENWQPSDLPTLKAVARSEGGTFNDLFAAVILTAVARLQPEGESARSRIALTADLRRFVAEPSLVAPANLSNVITVTVDRKDATDWRQMLRGMVAETRRLKAHGMGLQGLSLLLSMSKLSQVKLEERFNGLNRKAEQSGSVATAMTNLGQIEAEDVTFDHPAQTAVAFAPPMLPPRSLFSLSGYQDSLCLALPVFKETEEAVARLMTEVRSVMNTALQEIESKEGVA